MAPLSQREDDMLQLEDTHDTPVSSSSSWVSTTVRTSRMTFQVAARLLPAELLLRVMQEWLGRQRIVIDGFGHSNYTLSYVNPENPLPFTTISRTNDTPPSLVIEYFRSRIHSWLTDTKEFDDPSTFYLCHFLMSLKMNDNRVGVYLDLPTQPWATMLQDPNLTLTTNFPVINDHNLQYALFRHHPLPHGVERVKLDFSAEQYFALFGVSVPPFHYADTTLMGDNLYHDAYCHGAGLFLAHTKSLELHFGDAYKSTNPWYNVQEAAWRQTNPAWNYREARLRPNVCDSGKVIDWIMEYAWYAGFLQRIRKIRLSGDVQEWVKEKWQDIFKRHAEYTAAHPGEQIGIFAVHTPDPIELETIGMVGGGEENKDEDEEDEAWMPRNHYPPRCTCMIGCWRLQNGKIKEEIEPKTWDDFEQHEVEVVGDWMGNVELGPVV